MVKILIHIEGGVIQGIISDQPAEVYVIDYDTEGVEAGHPHLTRFAGDECLLYRDDPIINPNAIPPIKKTWETM
jgi:hypothetical protein